MDNLPKTSGVYLFYENSKTPIYIGKAVNIRERVKNHKDFFMRKVKRVNYIETGSEIEALILEANLIKKYQPKYNVMWRDDKNYFYICIAKNRQKIPYIFITHRPNPKPYTLNPIYIGPFTEGIALKKTLRFLRRAFPYYTSAKHSKNKCTWCHLDLCPGPMLMENPPTPEATARLREYKKNMGRLALILGGKRKSVLYSLENEMKKLSREKRFEEAGKIRDKIYNLQQVMSHTHIIESRTANLTRRENYAIAEFSRRIECYDVSNIQGKFATGSMVVFINGKPDKSQYKKFKIRIENKPNDIAMLKEILNRRFSHPEWPYPDAILIDGGKAQLNTALEIKKLKNLEIRVMALAKGRQELFIENKPRPIPIKNFPQEMQNLILRLDSEAHRFAISYHKKLRKKSLLF